MSIWHWLFGPTINGYYRHGTKVLYEASTIEAFCEQTIGWLSSGFSAYVILIPWYIGYQPISVGFNSDSLINRYSQMLQTHAKCLACLGSAYIILCLMRSTSRIRNPVYKRFTMSLKEREGISSAALLVEKRKWDINDYTYWSPDYYSKPAKPLIFKEESGCGVLYPVCHLIGRSFARWMIYPGATPLLNYVLRQTLQYERNQLLKSGLRAKVKTSKRDEIDTILFDRRDQDGDSQTLFITSEGNAGFMEVGSFTSLAKSSFSVLGWNHPGFGDSTGIPYPENDGAAMVAVIDYAIKYLHFAESDIVLYGWSIGGFSAAYGASVYPNLKGVYLDATFDDVMPLAEHVMPSILFPITKRTIKNIWNLNVGYYLSKFDGPVTLLRRNNDEVMQHNPKKTAENRANYLLLDFLKQRYPNLLTVQMERMVLNGLAINTKPDFNWWLEQHGDSPTAESIIESFITGNNNVRELGSDLDDENKTFIIIYLIQKHFVTIDATHGAPLPIDYVNIPWNIR